ncbi:MAG: PbsX family transcriptional regulator [Rubritepida sp.]|nr:PbsX family transcriptional regulator [Rubritepida sp.]
MTTASIKAQQTIQEWGNGLAVRLTAPIARAARLAQGTSVSVEVVDEGVLLRVTGKPKLTLAQKLKAFDPVKHGGEVAESGRVGAEIF